MTCQAKTGLLVLRACGQPSVGACSKCTKPLCGDHIGSGMCSECVVQGGGRRDPMAEEEATRSSYYRTYGPSAAAAALFGGAAYFSTRDAEAFTQPGPVPPSLPREQYDPKET